MLGFLKGLGAPIAFGALVLLAIITMVTDRRTLKESSGRDLSWWEGIVLEIAAPLQSIVAAPVDAVRSTWQSYFDLVGVGEENERLRTRVASLEESNLQYREALVSSGNLERIAAMRDEFEIPMLPSEIVGLDVSPWFRSVMIDRGTGHDVHAGYPVITDEGVVGLVTRTSAHAAKTMLVLDRQSTIDGVVQRSRVRGVVRGKGTDQLVFEFVARGGDVDVGDVIISSGMGGVYPKGLRIGAVVELLDPGGGLMQFATVQPAVDFGKLEQVFVMLHRGPSMELLYGTNTPEEPSTPAPVSAAPAEPAPPTNGPPAS
jgi:rod shape-determining protein MreC